MAAWWNFYFRLFADIVLSSWNNLLHHTFLASSAVRDGLWSHRSHAGMELCPTKARTPVVGVSSRHTLQNSTRWNICGDIGRSTSCRT